MSTVRKFLKENGGYIFALALVGAFLYVFNIQNPLFWDDTDWIVNNPVVHEFSAHNIGFIFTHDVLAGIGQVSNYYRPVLLLTFIFNYVISGTSPVFYHVISNAVHVANGMLVFILLFRWLKNKRAAFLAALLFVIHPLQTEAVAYISGRGDPLSVFWMLLGILLFVHFRERKKVIIAYATAGFAMILAVLSRETAVLFPGYLGISLMAFETPGFFIPRLKKVCLAIMPFIGVAAIYTALRLTVLNFQNTLNFYQHQNIYSQHITYRIFTFFHALLVYARLIVVPVRLHMERDIAVSLSIFSGWAWLGLLLMIALLGVLRRTYRRRSESFNIWLFGLGIFFINLIPTSGIVPINARIYEHWLYLSLFGFFAVAGWYTDKFLKYIEKRQPSWKITTVMVLVIYCGFLSIQTIRRNILWGNTEQFYLNILYYEPKNVRILNNLANWYVDKNNLDSAADMYQRAIEADPTQPAPYFNLGNMARDRRELDKAEDFYRKAITADPSFHYAYRNLAEIYFEEQKFSEALIALQNLQKLLPSPEAEAAIERIHQLGY